eukprot:228111-Ditylum_brightwellii.AAC.1
MMHGTYHLKAGSSARQLVTTHSASSTGIDVLSIFCPLREWILPSDMGMADASFQWSAISAKA